MSVWIRSQGLELTDALRAHAERRLRLVVARFRTRVRFVILRLDDVNGPRGGDDKRCQILADADQYRLGPCGASGSLATGRRNEEARELS